MRKPVFALCPLLALLFLTPGMLTAALANPESGLSSQQFHGNQTVNLAEAGLDEAMHLLRTQSLDGWELAGSDARLSVGDLALDNGATGELDVLIEGWRGTIPLVTAEGRIETASGSTTVKQLRMNLRPRVNFGAGITGQCRVTVIDSFVESYKSSVGPVHSPEFVRRDSGVVAVTSIEDGALDIGNSGILGYAFTGGGSIAAGPYGTVQGEDSFSSGIDPTRVAKDYTANFPPPPSPPPRSDPPAVDVPALETWIAANDIPRVVEDYASAADRDSGTHRTNYDTINTKTILGIPGSTTPLVVHADSIALAGGDALHIVGPVILVVGGDIAITQGSRLRVGFDVENKEGASLLLHSYGEISISGNGGLQNFTRVPADLAILGMAPNVTQCSHSQSFGLGGNWNWEAVVYAPNADIHLQAGGSNGFMAGAVVGMSVTLHPGSLFYCDEDTWNLFREFGWEVLPGAWEQDPMIAGTAATGGEGQQMPPDLSDLELRFHFSNTRSRSSPWKNGPRWWSVSAEIQTSDPEWTSQVVVSSPSSRIQAFLNHPEGLDSRSTISADFDRLVASISGTWSIDIDPDGEEPRRYYFDVNAAALQESQFAQFGIGFPAVGDAKLADEFSAEWSQPDAGTWDSLEYFLYHINPYKVEFSGDLNTNETSLTPPDRLKPGGKRLTVVYKNETGSFPEVEVGAPYDDATPAPFDWHVGEHSSYSRGSWDFSVVSRFQRWIAGYLSPEDRDNSEIGGLLASPQGDGLTNLEKYAFGMPPLSYHRSRLPMPGFIPAEEPGEPDYLTLTFRIVSDDPALGFDVGVSSDLTSWLYSETQAGEIQMDVTDNDDGTMTVTARAPKEPGQDRNFLRVLLSYD